MRNYFHKILKIYQYSEKNTETDENIQKLINCIDFLFDLLYPYIEQFVNKYVDCYYTPGFSTFNTERNDSFKSIIEGKLSNELLKSFTKGFQITFPSYDSKLPKISLEYNKERAFQEKLKTYTELNIDSSETYPCLQEFREFLELDIFEEDHFRIDEENNTFTLRNCWMILALGTLRLFKDIDEDNVVEGFEFTQFKSLEEADDHGKFYTLINNESDEKEVVEKQLYKYIEKNIPSEMKSLNNEEIKNEIKKFKCYKLNNISTFISYNAIKYFYKLIKNKCGMQNKDLHKYEVEVVEEVDYCCNIKIGIDQVFRIIHSRSYEEMLFAVAENYGYSMTDGFKYQCVIVFKRLKLKSENLSPSYNYGDINSSFFLPGFLPIYASIPDPFIDTFESKFKSSLDDSIELNFKSILDDSYSIVNKKLSFNKSFHKQDIISGLKSCNNFDQILKMAKGLVNIISDPKESNK